MSIEFYNISSTLQIEWNKVLTLKFCKITAPLIIKPLLVLGRRSIMKENMNIKRANVKERDLIIIKGHFVHLNYGLYLVVTIIHIFHSSSPLSLSLSRLLKCQKKTHSHNHKTHIFSHVYIILACQSLTKIHKTCKTWCKCILKHLMLYIICATLNSFSYINDLIFFRTITRHYLMLPFFMYC